MSCKDTCFYNLIPDVKWINGIIVVNISYLFQCDRHPYFKLLDSMLLIHIYIKIWDYSYASARGNTINVSVFLTKLQELIYTFTIKATFSLQLAQTTNHASHKWRKSVTAWKDITMAVHKCVMITIAHLTMANYINYF